MSELGAKGEVVSGAILARTVEPASVVDVGGGHSQETACLNCATPLTGDYCHACGQRAHIHRTLGAFFHDLLHGVLHFEGKVWRTLPTLAWRPGDLTRRYIAGERARFVSPVALFLFSVFLMFAVVNTTNNLGPGVSVNGKRDLVEAEREAIVALRKFRRQREAAIAKAQKVDKIDASIKGSVNQLRVIRTMRSRGVTEAVLTNPDVKFRSSLPWVEREYQKAKQNPQLLIYKLRTNSYKWSWALIPLSVPFLWLLFPFSRRFRTYDHVVFVTYSLSFMTLLVIIGSLLAYAGVAIAQVLLLIPPIHMFRQLEGAYSLTRLGALWRTVALTLSAVLVISLYIVLVVAVGIGD